MVVQVIGGKIPLPGDSCADHVGSAVFCAGEGALQSSVGEIQLVDR